MKIKRVEHTAIAVSSLGPSVDLLRNIFGLTLEYEEQIGQTRLAMLPVGEIYLELLEGQGPESGVTKWIGEKGPGLYPSAYGQRPHRAGRAAGLTRRLRLTARRPARRAPREDPPFVTPAGL